MHFSYCPHEAVEPPHSEYETSMEDSRGGQEKADQPRPHSQEHLGSLPTPRVRVPMHTGLTSLFSTHQSPLSSSLPSGVCGGEGEAAGRDRHIHFLPQHH